VVAYSDVPAVNTLYQEQAVISNGIAILDAGGTVGAFTVIPATPIPDGTPALSAMITTIVPSSEMITAVRAAMVTRYNQITEELIALGVTTTPPSTI
jgi:hypothetical protein